MSEELKAPKMPEDQELLARLTAEKARGDAPGARFIAYLSPQDQTATHLTDWRVHLEHTTSNWMGNITPDMKDYLTTPKLYGTFTVKVRASGPDLGTDVVAELLPDSEGCHYRPDVAVSIDNIGMIGLVTADNGKKLYYWTVSDTL